MSSEVPLNMMSTIMLASQEGNEANKSTDLALLQHDLDSSWHILCCNIAPLLQPRLQQQAHIRLIVVVAGCDPVRGPSRKRGLCLGSAGDNELHPWWELDEPTPI
eukprot:1156579-Pelagomonas_calceolata.AAC.7